MPRMEPLRDACLARAAGAAMLLLLLRIFGLAMVVLLVVVVGVLAAVADGGGEWSGSSSIMAEPAEYERLRSDGREMLARPSSEPLGVTAVRGSGVVRSRNCCGIGCGDTVASGIRE